MGFFRKLFQGSPTAELDERLAKLEREMRGLKLDWELAYEKLNTMLGRLARRAEKMHEQAEAEGNLYPNALPPQENDPNAIVWARLTPRQKQIQMQVYRRRHGGVPPVNGGEEK